MNKIYWKVYSKKIVKSRVRKTSVSANGRVCYSTRYWTFPPKNRMPFLFIFKNRASARTFAKKFPNRFISKCKIGKEVLVSTTTIDSMTSSIPDGTVFADKVKLIS